MLLDLSAALRQSRALSVAALEDLEITKLSVFFLPDMSMGEREKWLMAHLTTDPSEIVKRSAVTAELLHEGDYENLCTILESAERIERYRVLAKNPRERLTYCSAMVKALNEYVSGVDSVLRLLDGKENRELIRFGADVRAIASSNEFLQLKKKLHDISFLFKPPENVVVGINVNDSCSATQMAFVAVNRMAENDEALIPKASERTNCFAEESRVSRFGAFSHLETYVIKQIEKSCSDVLADVTQYIRQINTECLAVWCELVAPLRYYKASLDFCRLLNNTGHTLVCPDISGSGISISGVFSIYQAICSDSPPIKNDVTLERGSAAIIMGANGSGKTTLLKAVGQAVILAQLGFLLPFDSVRLGAYKQIVTQFFELSDGGTAHGNDEPERMKRITEECGKDSAVFINDPLQTADRYHAIETCENFISLLIRHGCVCAVATNLYDIYYSLSVKHPGAVRSLATVTHKNENDNLVFTYKLNENAPITAEYTRIIAAQYGIDYSRLVSDENKRAALCAYLEGGNV